MHFAVAICVLTSDQDNFGWADRQGATSPERVLNEKLANKTYLHSHCENVPDILFDLVYLDCIVDLLLSAPEEATEGIYKFFIDRTGTEVVALIFHGRHLGPFVFFDNILFYRV